MSMKRWLNILIIVCVLLTISSLEAEDKPLLESQGKFDIDELDKMRYRDFLKIKIFNKLSTRVFFMGGDDANKIGLDANELTDYLRLRIKNNFANITMEEPDFKKYTGKQTGSIILRVWFLGDSNPMVFHIKGEFWNYDYFGGRYKAIWDNERLGFGSKEKVLDGIKKSIDEMIEELEILFYKVRGEL